jgi:hypothetical protein
MERVRCRIIETMNRSGRPDRKLEIALHLGLVSFPDHATNDSALLAMAEARLTASEGDRSAPPPSA